MTNFIEIKIFETAKGYSAPYIERYASSEQDKQLDGYLGAQIGVDSKPTDRDIVYIIMTWENLEKYDTFLRTTHKEMHKNREKDEHLLSYRSVKFETIKTG